jgi:hypothetical protein
VAAAPASSGTGTGSSSSSSSSVGEDVVESVYGMSLAQRTICLSRKRPDLLKETHTFQVPVLQSSAARVLLDAKPVMLLRSRGSVGAAGVATPPVRGALACCSPPGRPTAAFDSKSCT